MTSRYSQIGNYIAWARNSDGYLKSCRSCGVLIYLHHDHDGVWRRYASWLAGDAAQREWRRHDCGALEPDVFASERKRSTLNKNSSAKMLKRADVNDEATLAVIEERLRELKLRIDKLPW